MRKTLWTALIALSFSSVCPAEEELVFQAGPSRNTLVQSFTSDASPHSNSALEWMTAQAGKDPKTLLWKEFVPVALHVSLWDADGWKDVLAKPEFDKMLLNYKGLWKVTNVFPPTVVANGEEWSGWARGQDVPSDRSESTGILTVRAGREPGLFAAVFKPQGPLAEESFTLHACLLAFGQRSKPADGKNRGRSLQHDFLAKQYRTFDFIFSRDAHTAVVELPPTKSLRGERFGVAFWVTKKGGFLPLQATGGYLP